jgi:deoxycytidine triphosphate deaminase
MPLFDALIKPALDSVTGLISEFHMSPEDKAKFELARVQAETSARQAAVDYDVKLNQIASDNIKADAATGDKFTERARPMFMYIIEAVFAANFLIIPLAHIFGSKAEPINLPADLLTLFGIAITGYSVSRTVEKVASLPGDSQISVLGMKVGNKQ